MAITDHYQYIIKLPVDMVAAFRISHFVSSSIYTYKVRLRNKDKYFAILLFMGEVQIVRVVQVI